MCPRILLSWTSEAGDHGSISRDLSGRDMSALPRHWFQSRYRTGAMDSITGSVTDSIDTKLQEIVKDWEAWHAAVHGSQSWIRLSD